MAALADPPALLAQVGGQRRQLGLVQLGGPARIDPQPGLVPAIRARFLRGLLGAYLALMACYGAGNIANDFWLEQVVKRGWTLWEIPDVTTPKASTAWAIVVIAAIVLWVAFVLPLVREPRSRPTQTAGTDTAS